MRMKRGAICSLFITPHVIKNNTLGLSKLVSNMTISTFDHNSGPYMECNSIGQIRGVPYFQQCINDGSGTVSEQARLEAAGANTRGTRPTKGQKRKSSSSNARKLIPTGSLTDAERSQLHIEIYEYFSWLHSELSELETEMRGRTKIGQMGMNVPGLQNVLIKLEGCFRNVGEHKKNKRREEKDNADGDAQGEQGDSEKGGGGATANDSEKENNTSTSKNQPLPILEGHLKYNLQQVVEENEEKAKAAAAAKRRRRSSGGEEQEEEQDGTFYTRTFENLFSRLEAFRAQHGHAAPKLKYKDPDGVNLGRWTGELRARRRDLRSEGLEYEKIDEPTFHNTFELRLSSEGRLGLTLQCPTNEEGNGDDDDASSNNEKTGRNESGSGGGAIVTAIDPACTFKDRISVGDKIMKVNGKPVKSLEDLQTAGEDDKVRVFAIAKKKVRGYHCTYLSEERVVSV